MLEDRALCRPAVAAYPGFLAMPYETRIHGPDGSLMVLIPAGCFLMGLPENDLLAEEHEKPQRHVQLPAYWIDVYSVTNARYTRFIEAGGYERREFWTAEGWEWRKRERVWHPLMWGEEGWDAAEQPVAGVSWYEADAYVRWAERRLPTDAQWEKAARGTDGRRYPWGNDWPSAETANFDMAVGRTTAVGLYPAGASPYGCHDMAGNVNNWTADWYWPEFGRLSAAHGSVIDPCCDDRLLGQHNIRDVTDRVDRGGGFATPREYQEVLGCTRKAHWPPGEREAWNGFRTVCAGPVSI
jgi:formylglycine-generating enzyme required for sulfatase activity